MEMARWTDHREIPHGKAKKSGVAKVWTRVSNLVGINSRNVRYFKLHESFRRTDKMQSVITTPEDVRIFHSDSKEHKKCKDGNAGWLFSQLLGDCLGLINGTRWTNLRSQVDPTFSHKASVDRLPETNESAQEYLNGLSQYGQTIDADKIMIVHAANAFMRFPLFHTAHVLYGSMTEESKQEFWAIGQTRLALLRHVISGGIFRFQATKWLKKGAVQELEAFQNRWYEFNSNMYKSAVAASSGAPIIALWQGVLDGTSSEVEVRC